VNYLVNPQNARCNNKDKDLKTVLKTTKITIIFLTGNQIFRCLKVKTVKRIQKVVAGWKAVMLRPNRIHCV